MDLAPGIHRDPSVELVRMEAIKCTNLFSKNENNHRDHQALLVKLLNYKIDYSIV